MQKMDFLQNKVSPLRCCHGHAKLYNNNNKKIPKVVNLSIWAKAVKLSKKKIQQHLFTPNLKYTNKLFLFSLDSYLFVCCKKNQHLNYKFFHLFSKFSPLFIYY